MTVGRSWRTYAKHTLVGNFLGQEVGAINSMAARENIDRCVWYDLTAGDGIAPNGYPWVRNCSPGLMASHAINLRVPSWVRLYEIQPATFGRLVESLTRQLPGLGYERAAGEGLTWTATTASGHTVRLQAIHASGSSASTSEIDEHDAVVALNDPNAITEWAMRPSFCAEIAARGAWCLRTLSTLGCNPAGLKRLPLAERTQWFDLIDAQQKTLPHYRDLLLAAIEKDDAQWAYLISTAKRWRSGTEKSTQTAFRKCGRAVAMSWYRDSRAEFEQTKQTLFLTKKERGGDAA